MSRRFDPVEIDAARTTDDPAERIEARTMARAVPGFFCRVPRHRTAEMRTGGIAGVQGPGGVTVNRMLVQPALHDDTTIERDFFHIGIVGNDPMRVLPCHIDIFASELAKGTQRLAVRIIKIGPWI